MITPTWYADVRQLRQFALISLPGFALVGFVIWKFTGSTTAAAVCGGIGVLVCLIGLASPEVIRPIYVLLMCLAFPIGWVISNVLLRVIFFLVMTPIGLVFRLIGRDPLRLRKTPTDSYWIDHENRTDVTGYYRQA